MAAWVESVQVRLFNLCNDYCMYIFESLCCAYSAYTCIYHYVLFLSVVNSSVRAPLFSHLLLLNYTTVVCPSNCINCLTDAQQCSTCESSYVIMNNLCVSSCPDGYSAVLGVCVSSASALSTGGTVAVIISVIVFVSLIAILAILYRRRIQASFSRLEFGLRQKLLDAQEEG